MAGDSADVEKVTASDAPSTDVEAVSVKVVEGATKAGAAVLNVGYSGVGATINLTTTLGLGAVSLVDKFFAVLLYGRIPKRQDGCCKLSSVDVILMVIHSMPWRLFLHICMVVCLMGVSLEIRSVDEMFMTKHVTDTFVANHFDSSHNTFLDIRRPPDVWEWGNNVLIPGLLGNNGPCDGTMNWGVMSAPVGQIASTLTSQRTCVEGWPDGDGSFHMEGTPTSYTVGEWATMMDDIDWTEGLAIRTVRVDETNGAACHADSYSTTCRPELITASEYLDTALVDTDNYGVVYGAGTTDFGSGDSASSAPFKYQTAAALGTFPALSAHLIGSTYAVPADGYIAVIKPFFADAWMPEQRGLASSIPFDSTSSNTHIVTRTNGKTPRYFCVRLSWDGEMLHQLCDPNDAHNRTTGLVRAAIVEFWSDLRRAHYIDTATRLVVIDLPLANNHMGVRTHARMMFEICSTGAVLPSYDALTRVFKASQLDATETFLNLAFFLILFFCMMEIFEIFGLEDGVFELSDVVDYISNMWNLMDWTVYLIFLMTYTAANTYIVAARSPVCTAATCSDIGYVDDHVLQNGARDVKMLLSLCVCVQLLKIMKLAAILVPKMGLAPAVLKQALPDMVFFSVVFGVSVYAFCNMLFIQLGPNMVEFQGQYSAFITLGRALFGDFDLDEIIENSPNYTNTIMYIVYLFVAVFILLSMFLAILGEAQANLRDDQRDKKKEAEKRGEKLPPEYAAQRRHQRNQSGCSSTAPPARPPVPRSC